MRFRILTTEEYIAIGKELDFEGVDIFYLPDYVELCKHIENDSIYVAFYESKNATIVYPFVLKNIFAGYLVNCDINTPLYDTHSIFEYGGPMVLNGNATFQEWINFNRAWKDYCMNKNIITSTIDKHPFLYSMPIALSQICVTSTTVYCVDLTRDLSTMYSKSVLKNIRKAKRYSISIVDSTSSKDSLTEFLKIYYDTMERVRARSFFFFPFDFFNELQSRLNSKYKLFLAKNAAGESIGGLILLLHSDFVHSFLSGWNNEYKKCKSNYLLFYEAIEWSKRQGYKVFHLGGGSVDLVKFKKQFSNSDSVLKITMNIYNNDIYNILNSNILPEKKYLMGNVFPPYRIGENTGFLSVNIEGIQGCYKA